MTASYAEYCRYMDAKCAPSLTSILIVPWLIKVTLQPLREAGLYERVRPRGVVTAFCRFNNAMPTASKALSYDISLND